jgi:peptidyl-prolyl cis-trans isomerase B (cyclophilin B)
LKSPAVFPAAVKALAGDDLQLLATAAAALDGTPDPDAAGPALWEALERLTRDAADTSRPTRLTIIDRLQHLPPGAFYLGNLRNDFDPMVRQAIAPEPDFRLRRWHRYPYQPTTDELASPPKTALIHMAGGLGVIELQLLVAEAPVTVARFAELVRTGYYRGLTFHRVIPNFVIQGGSPGANDFVGTVRFIRDEVGLPAHTRGAVGMAAEGPDMGDGQFFIDLVDLPSLDHVYTVFARVVSGLDVIDRIQDGARIEDIETR